MLKYLFYNKFPCLHVSSTVVLIIRRSNFVIQQLLSSHSLGGRPVHKLREAYQLVFSQPVHQKATYRV